MMSWLEREYPSWVTFFALATFAGIRPDRNNGEMFKLAHAIARDGLRSYFRAGILHISARIAKDGRARQVPLPKNLQQWLLRYLDFDGDTPGDRSLKQLGALARRKQR